jgi:hypothetical protein
MSVEDAELEALLLDAQVKEDYLDLGLMEPQELNASRATGRGTVEQLGEEVRAMESTSTGKKYKVKSVKGQAGLCLKYIGSGASFCLRKQCSTNHGGVGGGGLQSFIIPEGEVVAILKNPQVAFTAPILKLTSIENEVVEMWEVNPHRLKIGRRCS